MPIENDTPTEEGATNVALHQRDADPPYQRLVVNIQGDANPGKAIGFDSTGRLATLIVDENPFVSVDDEAGLNAALAAGRSIWLRGEGHGGVVTVTGVKAINTAGTVIRGPGHLQFTVPAAAEVRCLCPRASDITLRDFELSSTFDLATSNESGINIPGDSTPHRLKIQRLDIHNWHACIDKYGSLSTPFTNDILIEDCYLHTFHGWGIYLSCGVCRSTVRRCRVLGKQTGETHPQEVADAYYSNGRLEDVCLEDSVFGGVLGMGIEINPQEPSDCPKSIRPKVIRCRVENVGNMGVSLGHSVQGYCENVIVDGAKGIGIEIGGTDSGIGRCEATTLVACDVRNITDPAVYGILAGYSIDGTNDTMLLGCRAQAISNAVAPNVSNGVYVVDSDRCMIINCNFIDVGANGVHLFHGPDNPNTYGFHLVQGCTFRHTFNLPGGVDWVQRSAFISDINAVVRLNTTFLRPGGDMRYSSQCNTGAVTHCDSTPQGWADFTGSNNIIPVPA